MIHGSWLMLHQLGAHRAQNTAKKWCVNCSWFLNVIIPKWLINDSWSIGIFLEHVWIDQQCDETWTLGPRIYHQNTLKNTRTCGSILGTYYFHIWESEILKTLKVCVPHFFRNVVFFILNLFEIREFGHSTFESVKLGNWKLQI